MIAPPSSNGGANAPVASIAPPTQAPRPQRVLPEPTLSTDGGQTLAPRPLTTAEQAQYYTPDGPDAQYQGLRKGSGMFTYGSTATQRLILRRPDGKAVVVEAGQLINQETLYNAPEAGDYAAWFPGGVKPDSPYTQNKIREQQLEQMSRQQYEQQFGLPAGDPNTTWRGRLAQVIGGGAAQSAVGGAINAGTVGLMTGGIPGGILGFVGGGAVGYGIGLGAEAYAQNHEQITQWAAANNLRQAQEVFDQGLYGVMMWLAVPSMWTEQALGVGAQAVADPVDTFGNIGAAWEASRLFYESDPVATFNRDSKTFVDTDMPAVTGGVAALVEARQRIAGGEDAEQVFTEMQGRYGAFGLLRDLVGSSVLDPSNILAGALVNKSVALGAKAAGATTLAEAAERVKPRGLFQTLSGSGGLKDILQAYKDLKITQTFREGFTSARDLNFFQRALIGTDLLQAYTGEYTKPRPWEFWRLTPEALAHDRIVQGSNLLQAMITGRIPLDETFPARANAIVQAMRTAADIAPEGADEVGRVMASLEGSQLRRAMSEGGDVSGDLLGGWTRTRTEAGIVADMMERLKLTQAEVLANASKDWDALLKAYQAAGGVLPEGAAVNVIKETFKLFAEGTVPVSVEEYRAGLMSSLTEQVGQWAAKTFKVEAPSLLERVANLNKSAQSSILLGANPSYPINNVTNNEMTMVARGILAWRGVDQIVGDLERLGLSPMRMGEGLITGDLVGDAKAVMAQMGNADPDARGVLGTRTGARWGETAGESGMGPVKEATAVNGRIEQVQAMTSKVGRAMPFMKLSQKAETWYSARAFGNAALDMWSQVWRAGKGFDAMPDDLAAALRAVDPRLPGAITAAIESGSNPVSILDSVFSRLSHVSPAAYYDNAARAAGMSVEQMRQALTIGGLEQTLTDRLGLLVDPTPDDVRRVFNDVRIEAETHLAELTANQAKVEYEAAAYFAGDNGPRFVDGGAVLQLMDANRLRQIETHIEHTRILESIWDERLSGIYDADVLAARLREAGENLYTKGLFPLQQANIDGVASAFERGGKALPEEFRSIQRSIATATADFHEVKQALYKEFFALPSEQRTGAAWEAIQQQIDADYTNLTRHVAERQALMDDYIAAAYESHFPGSGDAVRAWRDLIRQHEALYQDAVREQFAAARQVSDGAARNRLWREFDARTIRQRTEWAAQERELRRAATELIPGREALADEARRLRGREALPKDGPIPKVVTPGSRSMRSVGRADILTRARSELPVELSTAIENEARVMLQAAREGEPGFRQYNPAELGGPPEVIGVASTYPDWYGRLTTELKKSRQAVMNGIQRIIDDKGKDVDRGAQTIIQDIKAEILKNLSKPNEVTGLPAEPAILRWMGAHENDVQAALEAWRAVGQDPIIPHFENTHPSLTPEQSDILVRNLQVVEARDNLSAGQQQARTYRLMMVDELGVAEVVDLSSGKTYEVRIDKAETEPMLPPGFMAQEAGGLPMPIASGQTEMYHQSVRPALEALRNEVTGSVERGRLALGEVSPELQDRVRNYVRAAGDKMGEAKLFTTRWGEYKRDAALLNYGRRYMADAYLGMVSPYQFWATHSVLAWAAEAIQRPALLATFYRTKRFLNTAVTRKGWPSRLAGRVKVDLPFMPDWMGGGVWVNPLNIGLPIDRFGDPWEQVTQTQSRLQDKTEDVLTDMLTNGEITRADYSAAMNYRPGAGDDLSAAVVQAAGVGMPTAYAEARRRVVAEDPSLRFDLGDLAVAAFPPSLLVYNAYQTLRGTPERISPLPITRDIRNLTAAFHEQTGMGPAGGVNLEAGIRRATGLPVFDQWGDYRTDRELANMAVEGKITPEQARAAMIERSGPIYELAMQREAEQGGANLMVQTFGRLFGGASVFPEGEMRGRQLQLLYAAARKAQDDGDTNAISTFFDRFPEVEARLALTQDPDRRLSNFLQDQVYAAYYALPTLYRAEVRQQFGDDFAQTFLVDKQYDQIDADTLATWARTLGRYVPGNVDGAPVDLALAPEGVAYVAERFYDERAGKWDMDQMYTVQSAYFDIPEHERVGMGPAPESVDVYYQQKDTLFPNIGEVLKAYSSLPKNSLPAARDAQFPGIQTTLDQYFALPKGTGERKAFMAAHPEVGQYFDWSDAYKAAHPEDQLRKNFRAANPILEQYFSWSDQFKAAHPEAANYMDSDAPRVRDVYMDEHPELDQYWTWRRAWMDANPEAAAWISEATPKNVGENRPDVEQTTQQQPAPKREVVGAPDLKLLVEAYVFGGRKLNYRAEQRIMPAFEKYGRDGQTLYQYLAGVLAAGGVLEEAK